MFSSRLAVVVFLTLLSCAGLLFLYGADGRARLLPDVDVEEVVYAVEPANNGAGPLWCFGSTWVVRVGDDVFVSGLETLKDAKPLHNVGGRGKVSTCNSLCSWASILASCRSSRLSICRG